MCVCATPYRYIESSGQLNLIAQWLEAAGGDDTSQLTFTCPPRIRDCIMGKTNLLCVQGKPACPVEVERSDAVLRTFLATKYNLAYFFFNQRTVSLGSMDTGKCCTCTDIQGVRSLIMYEFKNVGIIEQNCEQFLISLGLSG